MRAEAKLGVGDSYLGENNAASYVYAQNEFREFLAFYPTNPRADYAQMQLGMVHFNQMLNPQRDQTETRRRSRSSRRSSIDIRAVRTCRRCEQRLREARDRLSDWEARVGTTYLRMRHYGGAEPRYRYVLDNDPEYSRRDSVYFHLAETLEKSDRKAEALPYYERLVKEFEKSEYLEEAKKRIELLKQRSSRLPKGCNCYDAFVRRSSTRGNAATFTGISVNRR